MKEFEAQALPDNLRPFLALAAEEMIARGTETSLRQRLFVVLEELFNNISRYAYQSGPAGPVRMRFAADEDAVELCMEDEGDPFNLLEFDDAKRVKNLLDLEEGGQGIFLIKSLSTSVRYARVNGWNRVDVLIDGVLSWENS